MVQFNSGSAVESRINIPLELCVTFFFSFLDLNVLIYW